MKTRGQIEAAIAEATIQFEREFMGRGPLGIRSHLIDDMVVVQLKNVLIPVELRLAQEADSHRGRDLVKQNANGATGAGPTYAREGRP